MSADRIGFASVAAVVIGRNEGDRLVRCLCSVGAAVDRVVYVDSGSTDGSVEAAQAAGAEIVTLDLGQPFTAARARDAGVGMLAEHSPPTFIQFIDGDCELQAGWIATATAFLEAHPQTAVACGRRRERFPEASVYNYLCDREWDTPVGEARACGGDALMRYAAFQQVGGFDPSLIAGEEPELCVRLRVGGWRVFRLDAEMTLHDAAMMRFSQWWKRTRRGGYAAAEGMALHGAPPECLGVATVRRATLWGAALPLVSLLLAEAVSPWALILLLAYPAQVIRLGLRAGGGKRAYQEGFFMTLGKFAEFAGVMEYWIGRGLGRPASLIEYK